MTFSLPLLAGFNSSGLGATASPPDYASLSSAVDSSPVLAALTPVLNVAAGLTALRFLRAANDKTMTPEERIKRRRIHAVKVSRNGKLLRQWYLRRHCLNSRWGRI